ncbi:hypothetical protein IJD44_09870 [bacterium]|nr:hypothetical protein [bacterium]
MNFGEIKIGFEEYLLNKQMESNQGEDIDKSDIDVSIFGNIREFTEYVEKELKLDASDASELVKNLNQLQKYEIVNGQLVNPDEVQDEPQEDTEDVPPIDGEEVSGTENEDQDVVVGLMNELLQDKEFSQFLDRDEDGEINDKEINDFYDAIKDYDGDDKSISLEDIVGALQDIQDGKFTYPDEVEEVEEVEEPEEVQRPQASNASSAGRTTGGNRVGGSSGRRVATPSTGESSGENLESLSVEELETKQAEKQEELNTARADVNNVHNGQNEAVNAAKEDCATKEQEYIDAVKEADEELGTELETCLANIAAKEQEIDATKVSINDKEGEISAQEATIASTESSIAALNSSLTSLQGQSSDDPEMQSKIDAQISKINSQISELNAELEKQNLELDKMNSDLDDLNTKLQEQEDELAKLNSSDEDPRGKDQIEAEIAQLENSGPILAAKTAFEEAKANVESVKEAELATANEVVQTKQAELEAINTQLNEAKAKEIQKENAVSPFAMYNAEYGQKLADEAAALHPNNNYGGYCAAGVAESLVAATGRERTYGNGCDYTEVMRGRDDFVEYTDFDFDSMSAGEVQDFLLSLPAGTVVSLGATAGHPYGHVMIMDGQGNEISDGTNPVGTFYRDAYSSMSVHIPVG